MIRVWGFVLFAVHGFGLPVWSFHLSFYTAGSWAPEEPEPQTPKL